MKKLALLLVVMLSGCAFITESYLAAKFDPVEYQTIVKIRAMAKNSNVECSDHAASKANAIALSKELDYLIMYDEPVAHNTEVQHSLSELRNIVNGLVNQYTDAAIVSPAFCSIKFKIIENDAGIIQKVIGNKPR